MALEQVCGAMVRQVVEFGQDLQAISAGGGLSIPYHEDEEAIDTDHYFGLWNAAREQIAKHLGHPVKLEIEPGRFLVAESGVLVSQVRSVKEMGSRHFVLIDAGFNDLMRPAMYGSYHHITALAADGRDLRAAAQIETVVAGPLCESGDVFTQQEGGKWKPACCLRWRRGIIWCCTIPALTARRCLLTTTAVRYCRRCCSTTAKRG